MLGLKKKNLFFLYVQRNFVQADNPNHGEQHYLIALSSENYNYIKCSYLLLLAVVASTSSYLAGHSGLLTTVFLQVKESNGVASFKFLYLYWKLSYL